MNWFEGFGEDILPKNSPKQLKQFCYKQNINNLPFKFVIDPKKLLCAQINNFQSNEVQAVDLINANPQSGILIVDFIGFEREFVKNMTLIFDKVMKTLKDTRYSKIETYLSGPLKNIHQSHLTFLGKIHELMNNPTKNFVYLFIDELCSDKKLLENHNIYMNKFFDVESLVTSFSVEYSDQFKDDFSNYTLAQVMRSPIPWQNYATKFAIDLASTITKPEYIKKLNDFESQTSGMTQAIDCIPKLEAISKMMISEPFPIVVGGRRILKEGTAFKHCRSNITKREIYLFSDMFMYAQLNVGKLLAPANYPLSHLRVDIPAADKPLMALYAPKKSFVLQFQNQEELESWSASLKQAIDNAKSALGKIKKYHEAPIWISDSAAENCMECQKPFNALTRRRHHCRLCGRVLCADCVPRKVMILAISDKPEKVCETCFTNMKKKPMKKVKEILDQ